MRTSRLSRFHALALALGTACASAPSPSDTPSPADAAALSDQALALLPWDDATSLERATQLLDAALQSDPKLYPARANRALVELLVAASQRAEGARLASTAGESLVQSGRDLRERALDELRPLVREHPQDSAVLRALAVYYGMEGDGPQVEKLVGQVRGRASDPWLDFALLSLELQRGPPDAAVARLQAFAASHPALLRPRMMLARALVDRSEADQALATLDEILAANPRHDRAMRLKARLLAPPPPRVAAVPASGDAPPPPQKPGYLPRKRKDPAPAARHSPAPLPDP